MISAKDAKPLWDTLQDSYVDKLVVKRNLERHLKTEKEMLDRTDTILAVGGSMLGFPSKTNQLQILRVEDILLYGQQL